GDGDASLAGGAHRVHGGCPGGIGDGEGDAGDVEEIDAIEQRRPVVAVGRHAGEGGVAAIVEDGGAARYGSLVEEVEPGAALVLGRPDDVVDIDLRGGGGAGDVAPKGRVRQGGDPGALDAEDAEGDSDVQLRAADGRAPVEGGFKALVERRRDADHRLAERERAGQFPGRGWVGGHASPLPQSGGSSLSGIVPEDAVDRKWRRSRRDDGWRNTRS